MKRTPQEDFWAGNFGDEYTNRNKGAKLLASRNALFAQVLSKTRNVHSVIEFGANQGLNLIALRNLIPVAEFSAVEINGEAIRKLELLGDIRVYHKSIFNFSPDYQRDFVLSKGLLIHLDPGMLNKAYEILYKSSKQYICLSEYYNPTPVEITYRNNDGKLFKRDFAGEMLDMYSDLRLIDYGFVYRRDNNFPMDDTNWFLLERVNS